jgi:oxygen-independent coproporphyrinogen-3 oxidase
VDPTPANRADPARRSSGAFGVYIHFPYCTFHCPYCDFAVAVERAIPQERYTRAVLDELEARAGDFAGLQIRSLYLGGGTPSLWDPAAVAEVIAAVRARFGLPPGAEVTLEANPESSDVGRLAAYAGAGVNRISVGVQSFDPGVLAKLGRRHQPGDAEQAIRAAAEVLPNVTADLIYGARRSTVAIAAADAARLAALPVTHVSAYALTVDAEALAEEVPLARLWRQGRLPLPSDEEVVAQSRAIRAALRRAGLRRYEVSNYAKPGFASAHNQLYWESASYLGLGVGAFGCLQGAVGRRWGNHRSPGAYFEAIEAGRLPTAEEELLGAHERAEERVMLALRTRRGLPIAELTADQRKEIPALQAAHLAAVLQGRLVLTAAGLDVHSAVAERLLPRR